MLRYSNLIFGISLALASAQALALKSDRDQPATIDADEVDMDFNTGVRVYRGDVVVQQGTLVINADELTVYLKDDKLERAIAVGNPAVFRQRPDGKNHDVIGRGRRLELDEVNNIMTLKKRASVTQNKDTVNGELIVYNMATDKLQVRGGGQQAVEKTTTAEGEETIQKTSGRARVVIQPTSKKNNSTSN